ncbi:MAG TPA: histidinol-phosphatase, partial [Catenuloplanes sp.]
DLANTPNWAQFVPVLQRVDVIVGAVTGPAGDRDAMTAPQTAMAKSFDVARGTGRVTFTHSFGPVDAPFYLRLRGTDGNRTGPGPRGAGIDPGGPLMDTMGNADPWTDLWFYANPIWVLPQ